MRYHAIAIILLMIGSILSGCIGDDASTNDDIDDTAENIDGTINETVNQTTNDTAGNETTDGGNGTTNNTVQYVGFLDNSTVAGYQMNPGENFSNLGLMDSQSCTQRTNGLGFMKDGFCILDYGMMFNFTEAAWVTSMEINETEGCVELYVNDTSEGCLSAFGNISISGRVMWMEYLDHAEGPDGAITTNHCLVFIASPAFVASSQYNRMHNTDVDDGMDWNGLWADPAYEQWENERMSAYSVEEANAPSWCTTNIHFDTWYWMTATADTTPDPEPVQYVGFMDNSTMYGYRLDPGNFSRIFMPINEENCTTTGDADWLGVWNEPLCVQDYGNNMTYNETLDCLTASNDTMELCVNGINMSISNRVMWFKFTDNTDTCGVFINSEQFIPSSTYNLTYGIPIDWDQLWGDSAYIAWEAERMAAYSAEVGNQPGWCPNPKLDYLFWATQPAS
jgi:hypothetical protein